ncbi:MAG: SRPBCC family protein [Acidimicrobiales bacterium]|nr:SRPBCC family protein [Acidimicrobiales bacterium]HRW38896.1 SRPBCC family protein [Aquihabitans sp.]
MEDSVAMAGLVDREVRSGERDGQATRIVVARRRYGTDVDDLWTALTDPERLPRWFLPVSGDLREGGTYQTEGNAGGDILRCEAPSLLSLTWMMGERISWLELRLSPDGDGTILELVHEAPDDAEGRAFWAEYGPGAVGIGWDLALLGLGWHLDSGEALDPTEAMGYPLTPEGRAFVEAAAGSWAAAATVDGDDADAAGAAAERTVAFYTTLPDGDAPPEG